MQGLRELCEQPRESHSRPIGLVFLLLGAQTSTSSLCSPTVQPNLVDNRARDATGIVLTDALGFDHQYPSSNPTLGESRTILTSAYRNNNASEEHGVRM